MEGLIFIQYIASKFYSCFTRFLAAETERWRCFDSKTQEVSISFTFLFLPRKGALQIKQDQTKALSSKHARFITSLNMHNRKKGGGIRCLRKESCQLSISFVLSFTSCSHFRGKSIQPFPNCFLVGIQSKRHRHSEHSGLLEWLIPGTGRRCFASYSKTFHEKEKEEKRGLERYLKKPISSLGLSYTSESRMAKFSNEVEGSQYMKRVSFLRLSRMC